jgi:hypothetical protein
MLKDPASLQTKTSRETDLGAAKREAPPLTRIIMKQISLLIRDCEVF